jgi:hypothetical protein
MPQSTLCQLPITIITPPPATATLPELTEIVSWQRPHPASWYPRPGRTVIYRSQCTPDGGARQQEHRLFKIKGAGFYHPPHVQCSGFQRTTNPIPTSDRPQPPLTQGFCRDLIHVDPHPIAPHQLISVPSQSAPVGGMLLTTALNDQLIFQRLQAAGVPANSPWMVFGYEQLRLNHLPMGVSISLLPLNHLSHTPYDIYLHWQSDREEPPHEQTLQLDRLGAAILGWQDYSIEQPSHRLALLAAIARHAGQLILNFSTKAQLYRFSGSPDNFNLRWCPAAPLYLSDVDTAGDLWSIAIVQRVWEVLRNLLSALHQWLYFFLPALTYRASGYSWELWREHDFIAAMLSGFFPEATEQEIQRASAKIWQNLAAVQPMLDFDRPIPLRRGEHFLQQQCSRPQFYFLALSAIGHLIQNSPVQQDFPGGDTSLSGIDRYIQLSQQDPSHHI